MPTEKFCRASLNGRFLPISRTYLAAPHRVSRITARCVAAGGSHPLGDVAQTDAQYRVLGAHQRRLGDHRFDGLVAGMLQVVICPAASRSVATESDASQRGVQEAIHGLTADGARAGAEHDLSGGIGEHDHAVVGNGKHRY
jgi:hypothetical protein